MLSDIARGKIKEGLKQQGYYDEVLHEIVYNFYCNNGVLVSSSLSMLLPETYKTDYPHIVQAIKDSAFAVYDSSSNRIEFDEPDNKVTLDVNTVDDSYNWAVKKLQTDGFILYSEANAVLGANKQVVYKRLVEEHGAAMSGDKVILRSDGVKFMRTCPSCGSAKADSEFHNGRAMCISCYNLSRRVSPDTKAMQVQDLITAFNHSQKKLIRSVRAELKEMSEDFKEALEEILDDNKQ